MYISSLLLSLFVHEVGYANRTDNTEIDGTVQQILKIKRRVNN